MSKRTIVITGASDGVGAAAARRLAAAGHEVVVVGRSVSKTRRSPTNSGPTTSARISPISQRYAPWLTSFGTDPRIDVLANNAGSVFAADGPTVDGFDSVLQVNYLAAFLLTTSLMDLLIASRARIIWHVQFVATGDASRYVGGRPALREAGAPDCRIRGAPRSRSSCSLANCIVATADSGAIRRSRSTPGSSTATSARLRVRACSRSWSERTPNGSSASPRRRRAINWCGWPGRRGVKTFEPAGEYFVKRHIGRAHGSTYDSQQTSALWDCTLALLDH